MHQSYISAITTLSLVLLTGVTAQKCPVIAPAFEPTFAEGYSGRVVVNGLKYPRSMVFDSVGNLLVLEQAGGGVRWIKLNDNGGTDVCVAETKQLINSPTLNHGIALSLDGKTLFVSNVGNAYAYPYNATTGTVGARKTLITGMRNEAVHLTRSLYPSQKVPGLLLVQRGSDGNIDPPAAIIETARSQIRIFNISEIMQKETEYAKGEVLAWGIRNSVGFVEHPTTGGVWSVDNGVDDMHREGQDVHENNPCEELNYLGTLADPNSPERGKHYGYPDCFPAWDPAPLPNNTNIKVGTQFLIGDSSENRTDAMCAKSIPPKLCFASHMTPLDIKFNAAGDTGYIAFHGSSVRTIPDGYRVSKVAFDPATGMPKEPPTSRSAEVPVMWNADTAMCDHTHCFRPCGLQWDSKGRLWMASDGTNEIWILNGA
ncbi:soluble quino protein glucose dehydrogenase [Corynespora cassiicola Philippines]|uniref:Soluble quino protein glucose dehydrogenase n=1 Tax=Corynespora cassiicola Philippines TaxID=1448308 RepID=A0A2T2PB89_CORCC|nr:soluble quino protein glucose dehydrogenase [Corynespora cassiicola Philippines]